MDERYSAIPGAARKKHTGGPRLIIPRTFESNRRLIISRFFPPPHCASFYQRGRTEAEHSSRCCSRNNRGIPLLIFTAEMDHPKLFQRIRLESFGYRLIHKSTWNQRVITWQTYSPGFNNDRCSIFNCSSVVRVSSTCTLVFETGFFLERRYFFWFITPESSMLALYFSCYFFWRVTIENLIENHDQGRRSRVIIQSWSRCTGRKGGLRYKEEKRV